MIIIIISIDDKPTTSISSRVRSPLHCLLATAKQDRKAVLLKRTFQHNNSLMSKLDVLNCLESNIDSSAIPLTVSCTAALNGGQES